MHAFSVIEEETKETETNSAPTPVKKGIFGRWGSSKQDKAKTPGTPPNSPEPVRAPASEPEQGKSILSNLLHILRVPLSSVELLEVPKYRSQAINSRS